MNISTRGKPQEKNKTCYRCGLIGHFGRDPQCLAKGKTYRKCRGRDHFEKVCKTKPYARQVEMEPSDSQHDCAFSINEVDHSELTTYQIGVVDLTMTIDSGDNSTIIDEGTHMCHVFYVRVHEGALNDAIKYAQKGCAMQL